MSGLFRGANLWEVNVWGTLMVEKGYGARFVNLDFSQGHLHP